MVASVSVLPPILRKVLPESVVDLPVSAPLDAALAKAFPKVRDGDTREKDMHITYIYIYP